MPVDKKNDNSVMAMAAVILTAIGAVIWALTGDPFGRLLFWVFGPWILGVLVFGFFMGEPPRKGRPWNI